MLLINNYAKIQPSLILEIDEFLFDFISSKNPIPDISSIQLCLSILNKVIICIFLKLIIFVIRY